MNESATHPRFPSLTVLLFFGVVLVLAGFSSSFGTRTGTHGSLNSSTLTRNMATDARVEEVSFQGDVDKEHRRDTAGFIPLIDIGTTAAAATTTTISADNNSDGITSLSREVSIDLVSALRDSGFALVRSPLLSKDMQSRAIEATSRYLADSSNAPEDGNCTKAGSETTGVDIIPHPTDPKVYVMLDSEDQYDLVAPDNKAITEYVRALRSIKTDVLRLIAIGLDMDDADFFTKLHNEDNDTLRLITYFPTHSETTGNRCKEHSDYGTITLLSTDSVSGLELFHKGTWLPVPFVEGTLVVNVGSLLAGWTKGTLRATLHRVAGPASENSESDRQVLVEATKQSRTSIAYFVDPNRHVSESLAATTATEKDDLTDALRGMSVAEYIRWRSGGDGVERSGVSFIPEESKIIANEK